jgi:hypothetical protein
MRKLLIYFIIVWVLISFSVSLSAVVKVKVKGIVETKNKKPKPDEKSTALQNGKVQALKKYISGLDSQRLQILNELMPEIQANLDTYILESTNLSDGEYLNGQWEINLEVSINDAQIEQLVNSRMKDKLSKQAETYLSFVYVAREVGSVEKFDVTVNKQNNANTKISGDRTVNTNTNTNTQTDTVNKTTTNVDQTTASASQSNTITNTDANQTTNQSSDSINGKVSTRYDDGTVKAKVTQSGSQSTSNQDSNSTTDQTTTTNQAGASNTNTKVITKGSENTNTNVNTTTNTSLNQTTDVTNSTQTSGSVVKKSEELGYRGYNPSEIDTKVTEIFNKASFEVVPAYEVNITPEQFATDFATLNEISSSTQKEATNLAREGGLDFLAIGMLDVGREETDPVTGQYKIYVKVNGYIMDLRKKFAVKICSVGPVQYSGFGENPTVAKTNALIEASTKASKDLVDQLRVKLSSN